MEFRKNRVDEQSVYQDFSAYGGEYQHSESPRVWFAVDKFAATNDNSDLMDESPPSTNDNHYNHKQQVRGHSDTLYYHQDNHQKHQQLHQYYAQSQTLGIGNEGQICNIEREHMFDKVVTPSDVGKLNRLVIPKQHAEKYFPLDSYSNEKGLLLNFEDLTGKEWRFRYSYWNSSQSYVMTKGWSRFVKDKKLNAGDIVSFQRGVSDNHRLFIDWKRRPIATMPVDVSQFHSQFYRSNVGIIPSWSPFLLRPQPNRVHHGINHQIENPTSHYYSGYGNGHYTGQAVTNNASVVYLTAPERIGMTHGRGGNVGERIHEVVESVLLVQRKRMGSGVAKRLRLFGVNMECPGSSESTSTSDEFEMLSASLAIPFNSPTAQNLNQCPSSSALLLPSTTSIFHGTPISNKENKSLSMDIGF